jgi:hypothetical protein
VTDAGISRGEVVAALSLATDLAMGQPLESGLGICLLALALGARGGGCRSASRSWSAPCWRAAGSSS